MPVAAAVRGSQCCCNAPAAAVRWVLAASDACATLACTPLCLIRRLLPEAFGAEVNSSTAPRRSANFPTLRTPQWVAHSLARTHAGQCSSMIRKVMTKASDKIIYLWSKGVEYGISEKLLANLYDRRPLNERVC